MGAARSSSTPRGQCRGAQGTHASRARGGGAETSFEWFSLRYYERNKLQSKLACSKVETTGRWPVSFLRATSATARDTRLWRAVHGTQRQRTDSYHLLKSRSKVGISGILARGRRYRENPTWIRNLFPSQSAFCCGRTREPGRGRKS